MFKKIPAVKTAVITIAVFVAVSSFFIIDLTVVNSYADTTVKTAVVKKGPLRIRRGPGTDYKICGLLAKGNAIGITDISGSWYKIIYSSKTGYVSKKYIVLKGTEAITYSSQRKGCIIKKTSLKKSASKKSVSYKSCSTGAILILKGEYIQKNKTRWYKTAYRGKAAYVLKSTVKQVRYTAYSKVKKGTTKERLNIRKGPSTSFVKVGTTEKGNCIDIYGKLKWGKTYWYRIKYRSSYCYIASEYVKINSETTANKVCSSDFEKYMKTEGFPESYKSYLRKLHKAHPKWVFKAQKTGITWSTMLNAENKLGNNLVEPTESAAWKTFRKGAYDFTRNRYVRFDGRWNQASKAVIAYYLDPRNGLNESNIYEFMEHRFSSTSQNKNTIKSIVSSVNGCFMNNKKYIMSLYKAGKKSKVNPNVITAMVVLEQGWKGGSGLISGNYSGYKGIYNHFNIGAYTTVKMSATQRGLWWAKGAGKGATTYSRPWNTITKSLYGGAIFYRSNYISKKQNTYYLKKFNAMNGSYSLPKHEYSTAVFAAVSEGKIAKRAYNRNNNYAIKFYVPVYTGMPAKACSKPGTAGNNDYYLKSLSVSGKKISPKFNRYIRGYKLTVGAGVSAVKINAKAHGSGAKISGTGTVALKTGINTKYVTVKATSGAKLKYKLLIIRS